MQIACEGRTSNVSEVKSHSLAGCRLDRQTRKEHGRAYARRDAPRRATTTRLPPTLLMAKRLREDTLTTNEEQTPPEELAHTPKWTELETESDDNQKTFQCLLPPHKPLLFSSYCDFESHYNQNHTSRCRECHKSFPSSHYLELHLTENHDPIVATKRDKGEKTYACFVEGCDKVCLEWKKRRSHLVDKHGFPKNYDFFIVNDGSDGRSTMLRPGVDVFGHRSSSRERGRRASSATTTRKTNASSMSLATDSIVERKIHGTETGSSEKTNEKESSMDDVTKSMSALQLVPRSVAFGTRKPKSGFAKS